MTQCQEHGRLPESTAMHGADCAAVLNAFGDVAAALRAEEELDVLLAIIAARLCALARVSRCTVYLRDQGSELFHGHLAHASTDIDDAVRRLVAGGDADAFTRQIVSERRPVLIADATRDPRPVRAAMRRFGVTSMLGVPLICDDEVAGVLFLDNEGAEHPFDAPTQATAAAFADLAGIAIGQARQTASIRTSMRTVARQNALLRRAAAMDDRLAELTLKSATLQHIAEAVAELSGKPAAIYDAELNLRVAVAAPGAGDGVVPRLLEPPYREAREVGDALAALDDAGPAVVGPIPDAGLHHRHLVAPVTVRDDRWGYVVVMEFGARFGSLDAHIARRAAMHVALEMAAERRAATIEWDARASLAGELVRGNPDLELLQRRSEFLKLDLQRPHALCLIAADDSEPAVTPLPRAVAGALGAALDGATVLTSSVPEGVAAIVALPAVDEGGIAALKSALGRALSSLPSGSSLRTGISGICAGPAGFSRAYAEAQQVLRCQQNFAGPGQLRILAAADLGAGRPFLASADRAEAERFVTESLGPLLDNEAGNEALVATLAAFLRHSCHFRRCAADLHVHQNTVRYRLARVEQVTSLQVTTNTADQLTAQLAVLILRLTGRVDESVAR
jgi:sugar diacid utilization regulator